MVMSEYAGKPKNEDIFKYDVLLGYLSGALLAHRGEMDEIDYFNLAWTNEINSNYKEAIADYTKSLKGDFTETTFPARSVILGGRAKCKFAVEDYYGAINDFSSAIEAAPKLRAIILTEEGVMQ
jgi:tetratricopeptide (TPR) repeat protein